MKIEFIKRNKKDDKIKSIMPEHYAYYLFVNQNMEVFTPSNNGDGMYLKNVSKGAKNNLPYYFEPVIK